MHQCQRCEYIMTPEDEELNDRAWLYCQSNYTRCFDYRSNMYSAANLDNSQNLYFLLKTQHTCNLILKRRGWLRLNEVYDMLDLERTSDEDIGWVQGPVDFGLYDIHNETARGFVNGTLDYVVLVFNVNGLVPKGV